MTPGRTQAFETYVAPARARPQLWRLGLGIGIVALCHVAWMGLLFAALRFGTDPAGGLAAALAHGSSPAAMTLLLFTFAGLGFGAALAVRLAHRRAAGTLIGPRPQALRDFAAGAALLLAVYAVAGLTAMLVLALRGGPGLADWMLPGLEPGLWLRWLPLAILALLVQTGAEELVFRGYLQQQLAARFRSALVWMLLPSVLFGLLHHDAVAMGGNAWLVVAATGVFGLIAADLTARSGTLGMAWGLHFANNCLAILIVAPQGDLSGLALWRSAFATDDTGPFRAMLLADMAVLLAVWALARTWLRKRSEGER